MFGPHLVNTKIFKQLRKCLYSLVEYSVENHSCRFYFQVLQTTLDRTQQLKSDTMLMCSNGSVAQLTSPSSMFRLGCLISQSLLITQREYNTPSLTFSVLTYMSFNVLILNRKIKITPLEQQKNFKFLQLMGL